MKKIKKHLLSILLLVILCFLGIGSYEENESNSVTNNLNSASISDWNWSKDYDFGTKGVIKWNVEVSNNSNKYIEYVTVEFATYDKDNRLVSSNFTFIKAIPPHNSRTESSYADLYRTEKDAKIKITKVKFSE